MAMKRVVAAGNPEFRRAVDESFRSQSIMQLFGARLTLIEPGHVVIELPFDSRLTQHHGYLHAGVISTIGDNAGGFAGLTVMPPSSSVLTIEYKINFLAPGRGDLFRAEGHVLRAGRTLVITRFEITAVTATEEICCAVGQQSLMRVATVPEPSPES